MPTRYAYLITRINGRVMSRGTLVGDDPAALAAELLARNQCEHSYYTGPRRCSIWPHPAEEPVPDTPPAGAQQFDV
jgi:hypothetical protein